MWLVLKIISIMKSNIRRLETKKKMSCQVWSFSPLKELLRHRAFCRTRPAVWKRGAGERGWAQAGLQVFKDGRVWEALLSHGKMDRLASG